MTRLFRWFARLPFGSNTALDIEEERDPSTLRPIAPEVQPSMECIDLQRGFGEGEMRSLALKSVSLALYPGHLNLLMGPSGSGKSTLLAVLSGLLRPDGGKVIALGEEVWRMPEPEMEAFRLRHFSFIFQGYNLFPALTARQQLEMVLRWGENATGSEARDRANDVLARLGLSKKAHLRPAQLSGGEKQRVAIGRALVKQPTFMFADEPTSALDWENGQQVVEMLVAAARDQGTTVLVVTHDERLLPFADRVFHLCDGRLADEAAPHTPHPVATTPARLTLYAPD